MTPDDVVSIIKATSDNGISFWQAVLAAAIPGAISIFIMYFQFKHNRQKEINDSKKEARYFYYYLEQLIIERKEWKASYKAYVKYKENIDNLEGVSNRDIVLNVKKNVQLECEKKVVNIINKLNEIPIDGMEYYFFSLALKAKELCIHPTTMIMDDGVTEMEEIRDEFMKYIK
ncbi:hypothetical protein [Listeria booriae]|uniref:Uncharacterized protein n=1 Tax=Listeria booriae TaxID=1552123 RepID=A0A842FDB9_9LIST|nr:hypothetical protein [Listeria booriae]MBC2241831.1 hypothetical protein [Listeria booriae]